jgi:chemotaxis protein CheD
MIEIATSLPEVNLQPGELHLTRNPTILQTILGSCVGVTFWSKRLGAGALCHGVLPRRPKQLYSGDPAVDGRYVDFSIQYLARAFDSLGAGRKEVEVKVFGGSDVLPVSLSRGARDTVGALNTQAALEVLEAEGFTVLASDLGGNRGRKIQFDTGTGIVLVYKLNAWRDIS